MSLSVLDLVIDSKDVEIPMYGGSLNVSYAPTKCSPATLKKFAAIDRMDDIAKADTVVTILCDIVTAWDFLDKDGSAYPLDRERVETLPMDFLAKVIQGVVEDVNLKKSPAATSLASGTRQKGTSFTRYVKKGR